MRILFVIERFAPYTDASAKVLNNLLSSDEFKGHELHVVSLGEIDFQDNGIHIHSVGYKEDLIYKIKQKMFSGKFVRNNRLIRAFENKVNQVCFENNIDHVIFVLGNMNFLFLSRRIDMKFSLIFYDTFLNNYFYKKESVKKICGLQSNAFSKAINIFLLEEYLPVYRSHHKEFDSKFHSFYITAFYDNSDVENKNSNILLHSGAFFAGLRDPIKFFDFLKCCIKNNINIKAVTLGDLPKTIDKTIIPKNLEIRKRVFGPEYVELVSSAGCLVLVDNNPECCQIPSKAYEYIGYNKKILFFTSGETNTNNLLSNNKNVFKISEEIDKQTVQSFLEFLQSEVFNERISYYKNEKDYVAHYLLEKLQ